MLRFFCVFMLGSSVAFGQSGSLEYQPLTEPIQYQVTITADSPSEIKTMKGRISYSSTEGPDESLTYAFSGGLKESVKRKASSSPGRGFRGGPPRGLSGGPFGRSGSSFPRGPFGRSAPTTALQQSKANVTVTPDGDVLKLTGESQIPLPLGHLSLLVFEALPLDGKDAWATSNGVTLGRKEDDRDRFRRGPFGNAPKETQSAGSDSAQYKVTSRDGDRITIQKTYELKSPNSESPFDMVGGGTLVFDSSKGMYVSSDLEYTITVTSSNVQVKIPVTVKFESLSAEAIAAAKKQQEAKAAEAAKAGMAKALARFEGKEETEIAAIYQKGGQVPPTGLTLTADMEIPVGLVIQNKWPTEYRYSACRVAQVLADNMLKIQSIESKRFYVRKRSTLFLPQNYVAQPDASAADVAALYAAAGHEPPSSTTPVPKAEDFRPWQDSTGTFTVEAKLIRIEGANVVLLRKSDNKELTLPKTRLSASDQTYLNAR